MHPPIANPDQTLESLILQLESLLDATSAGTSQRIAHARTRLREELAADLLAPLLLSLDALQAQLERVDFGFLKKGGFLARATVEGRSAGSALISRCRDVVAARESAKVHARELLTGHERQARAIDAAAAEFQQECTSLDDAVTEGAGWLRKAWGQMATRKATAASAAERTELREPGARIDAFASQLKALHEISEGAKELCAHGRAIVDQRTVFVERLRLALDEEADAWADSFAQVAPACADPAAPIRGLPQAAAAHRDLSKALGELIALGRDLQQSERAMRDGLAAR